MIFKTRIEGYFGSPYGGKSDSICVFFTAFGDDQARAKRETIYKVLVDDKPDYEVGPYYDELQLHSSSLEPDAFKDAFLFECGTEEDGSITYDDDALVFCIGEDRVRVLDALKEVNSINTTRLLERGREWAEGHLESCYSKLRTATPEQFEEWKALQAREDRSEGTPPDKALKPR